MTSVGAGGVRPTARWLQATANGHEQRAEEEDDQQVAEHEAARVDGRLLRALGGLDALGDDGERLELALLPRRADGRRAVARALGDRLYSLGHALSSV